MELKLQMLCELVLLSGRLESRIYWAIQRTLQCCSMPFPMPSFTTCAEAYTSASVIAAFCCFLLTTKFCLPVSYNYAGLGLVMCVRVCIIAMLAGATLTAVLRFSMPLSHRVPRASPMPSMPPLGALQSLSTPIMYVCVCVCVRVCV